MIRRHAFLQGPVFSVALGLATAGAQEPARLVKDANRAQGEFNANIAWVMPVGKQVVFPMDTLGRGYEPWISDGTKAGTRFASCDLRKTII